MVETFPLEKANEAYGKSFLLNEARILFRQQGTDPNTEAMKKGSVRFRAVITMD